MFLEVCPILFFFYVYIEIIKYAFNYTPVCHCASLMYALKFHSVVAWWQGLCVSVAVAL